VIELRYCSETIVLIICLILGVITAALNLVWPISMYLYYSYAGYEVVLMINRAAFAITFPASIVGLAWSLGYAAEYAVNRRWYELALYLLAAALNMLGFIGAFVIAQLHFDTLDEVKVFVGSAISEAALAAVAKDVADLGVTHVYALDGESFMKLYYAAKVGGTAECVAYCPDLNVCCLETCRQAYAYCIGNLPSSKPDLLPSCIRMYMRMNRVSKLAR